MRTGVMFLDGPASIGQHGTARCGLPAAVECRYTLSSSEGPLESMKSAARARSLLQRADRGADQEKHGWPRNTAPGP